MTHFTTDEHGNQIFTHEGWEVRVWSCEWARRIHVTSPDSGDTREVEVDADGIWVNGSSRSAWSDGPCAFTIPWPVVEAIVEARATVGT